MFALLGRRVCFDDFRRNGMLLPARDESAARMGLPLQRGPHRAYNDMVLHRLGAIEANWAARRARRGEEADLAALMRITLLQKALRKRLLDERAPLVLNRRLVLGIERDFSLLDALAEDLWKASAS